MKYFLFFINLLLILISCHSNNKNVNKQSSKTDGPIAHFIYNNKIEREDSIKRMQLEYRKQDLQDSLIAESMLEPMLKLASKNLHKRYFEKKIPKADTDAYSFIRLGNLFSKKQRHLLIRRVVSPMIVYIDIYFIKNNQLKHIFSYNDWYMAYVNDTLKDINGDKYNDFLFHYYPVSGCCRRDVYYVYLYNNKTGKFSEQYKFINPTFSPSEKIIRGVEYGHPGEVPLYKFKWKGTKLDTIEFIYPADTLKKKFYIVKNWRDLENPPKRKLITSVPKEYLKVKSYDWFINY